jgi:hypothetical protein
MPPPRQAQAVMRQPGGGVRWISIGLFTSTYPMPRHFPGVAATALPISLITATTERTLTPDPLKLTPALRAMLERIATHSGSLLMLAVTASGHSEESKLNKLRGAGYVVNATIQP